jgi:hemoglobin-like flavoprotein
MNHRQLVLIRSSYGRIRCLGPLFADLFNRRLVLIAPVLDRLLPSDAAERDDAFLRLLDAVVDGLDRLDLLLPALAEQARRWRRAGVEPADYDVAGMVLAWSIEQALPTSPSAVQAWRDAFDLLAGVMRTAAMDPGSRQVVLPGPTHTPPYYWSPRTEPPRSRHSSGAPPH